MVAVVDYGVGNLFSLCSSLAAIGAEAVVTDDPAVLAAADRIILPGVGAFGDAADKLRERGLFDVLRLLFEKGFEYGEHEGLGLIKGEVRPIAEVIPADLKIPHIGWNALHFVGEKSPIFRYLDEGDFVYFVHSFYGENDDGSVIATAEYGAHLTAAVGRGNVYGCQFHPEKSGNVGLKILKAFCEA